MIGYSKVCVTEEEKVGIKMYLLINKWNKNFTPNL